MNRNPRGPSLPSVLPSHPGLQDTTTTPAQIDTGLAHATNPQETAIFICTLHDCNKLFPSREKLILHRKREHEGSEESGFIITWNGPPESST